MYLTAQIDISGDGVTLLGKEGGGAVISTNYSTAIPCVRLNTEI
jgi:hypothetical protein